MARCTGNATVELFKGRATAVAATSDMSLYRDDLSHLEENPKLQSSEIEFQVDGARIILVDDVLFTGRTIRGKPWSNQVWTSSHLPAPGKLGNISFGQPAKI